MLMSERVFDSLHTADVRLAWSLIGEEVLKKFTDEHVTAVPFFQTSKCPCGPGYIILSKFRSIKRCLRRLPHYRVFTECLWDYTPCTDDGLSPASMIPIVTVCDRPASTFRFVASGMRGNESKTIKITFHGKRVSELDLRQHKLLDRNVSTLLFDDAGFDGLKLHMVNRVYSIDRGRIEVWVDNDVDVINIVDHSPIGFKMYKLSVNETDEGERYIDFVRDVNSKRFKALWLNRDNYSQIIRNFIPNQSKYGGEAGDVN
ncbi:uncharacterized protein LOC128156838 [Crassostrea angulata]|uniref:uncharacterized protein LOC128156838 n=1 Tax=Magallana angulata TaxID=2784310 RepID=UPI0022B0AA84|nr:uncharacterized protein LOC128156838 [Crassostrea angulata]